MKTHYPEEKGSIDIQGHKMSWTMRRSKTESAFGIRGSRIFELKLMRDGQLAGEYDKGWSMKPLSDDDASSICVGYLVDKYGKNEKKKKGDKWDHE